MLVDTFLLINKKIIVKAKNDIILIKIERLRAYCDVIPKTRNVKKLICPTLWRAVYSLDTVQSHQNTKDCGLEYAFVQT